MTRAGGHLSAMAFLGGLLLVVAEAGAQSQGPAPAREAWDLVALGDSTPAGYGLPTGRSYVDLVAAALGTEHGRTVRVHNWATVATLTVRSHVQRVRENVELRSDLRNAELVTLWLGWHDVIPAILGGGPVDRESLGALTDPMRASFRELLAEIASLVATSTPVLVADLGNPFVPLWRREGRMDVLKTEAFEVWRGYLLDAAAASAAVVVPTYRALNGPDGEQPVAAGYLQADGLHFNEAGHALLARLHREALRDLGL